MINILFLASNPIDTSSLRLDEEIRAIDQHLQKSKNSQMFEIKQAWAVRISDLQEALLRYQPDIVHFSGHGSETNEILLMDASGTKQAVSNRALANLFSTLKDKIRCVVLNACYSEQQAGEIAKNIDCVIGISKAFSDKAAIDFSASFYQALGYGMNVKVAFDLGCNQIDLAGLKDFEEPKLLGNRLDPKQIFFVETSDEEQREKDNQLVEALLLKSLLTQSVPPPSPTQPTPMPQPASPTSQEAQLVPVVKSAVQTFVFCSTCGVLAGYAKLCTRKSRGHTFTIVDKKVRVFCKHCGMTPGSSPEECIDPAQGHFFVMIDADKKVFCSQCGSGLSDKPCSCMPGSRKHKFGVY